jgi:hypothetical protein
VSWGWAIATCRGTSHLRDTSECQDTSCCIAAGDDKNILVAVVSDGAGSAPYSKQGSLITCRTISESARLHFAETELAPDDDEIWSWIDRIRDRIYLASQRLVSSPRDLAATLVAVIAMPSGTIVLHVGDGAAVVNMEGQWSVPSWPAHGEYASATYFVTDDPTVDLRITRLPYPVSGVGLFSDGLERLVLRFADQTPSATFFDKFAATVRTSTSPGTNLRLNASLKQYLNSAAINERTDDDKSLIIAVRQ